MEKETQGVHKKKRKKKKKTHRIYAAIVMLLGIVILLLGFLLLFHIQKIEIRGNEYCSDQEIAKVVQSDRLSDNSLYVVCKYAIGRGEKLPCFETMKVRMQNPWTIRIQVEEKAIVGCLKDGKDYTFFDRDGLVVKQSVAPMQGIPVVEGIDLNQVKLYQKLESKKTKILEKILEASSEAKKYELSIDKIEYKDNKICLYIGNVCVNLGNTVTSEKVAQIPPIIEKLGKKKGTLHLENYSTGQGTITFEKKGKTKEKSK